MKLLLITLLFTISTTSFAGEIRTRAVVSKKSCSDASNMADKLMKNEQELKNILAQGNVTYSNYESYSLGKCERADLSDHVGLRYVIPILVRFSAPLFRTRGKILEVTDNFVYKSRAEEFKESLTNKSNSQRTLTEALKKYEGLQANEIDYTAVIDGGYDHRKRKQMFTTVVVLKD